MALCCLPKQLIIENFDSLTRKIVKKGVSHKLPENQRKLTAKAFLMYKTHIQILDIQIQLLTTMYVKQTGFRTTNQNAIMSYTATRKVTECIFVTKMFMVAYTS